MKSNKIIVCLLSITILLCLSMGCSKKKEENIFSQIEDNEVEVTIDDQQKVGYVREVVSDKVETFPFFQEGNSYGYFTMDNHNMSLQLYSLIDEKKDSSDCKWYSDLCKQGYDVNSISIGYDGNIYIVGINEDSENEDSEAELFEYKDQQLNQCNVAEDSKFISKVNVLKDGTIVYVDSQGIRCIGQMQEELFVSSDYNDYCTDGEFLYSFMNQYNEIHQLSQTGEVEKIYHFDDELYILRMIGCDKTALYMMTSDGLYQLDFSTLICSKLMSIDNIDEVSEGNDLYMVKDSEGNSSFYTYTASEEEIKLLRYAKGEELPVIEKSKNLKICSLYQNKVIQSNVYAFESKNSEIDVEYSWILDDYDADYTDAVNAIITELIAGNGADLYCMKNLPMESYLEKGVLADLSYIIDPMVENEELSSNIISSFTIGGLLYSVPLRFDVPVIYGDTEVIDSMQSLDTLYDCILSHPGEQLLGLCNPDSIVALYADEIVTNVVNEDKLEKLFAISDEYTGQYEPSDRGLWYLGNRNEADFVVNGSFSKYTYQQDDRKARMLQLTCFDLENYVNWLAVETLSDMSYDSFQNGFIANTVMGMNRQSKNKENAVKFLQFTLSEERQKVDLEGGFPVNLIAMEDIFSGAVLVTSYGVDVDGERIEVRQPTKEQLSKLKELILDLDYRIPFDISKIDSLQDIVSAYESGDMVQVQDKIEQLNNELTLKAEE